MAQAKRIRLSSVTRRKAFLEAGSCAQVAMIADAMATKPRSEVVGKCVALGINEHTARTQYQKWYSTHR